MGTSLARSGAVLLRAGVALALAIGLAFSAVAVAPSASAILPPDSLATGDPAPPDQTPPPEGLDQPALTPDDSVVEQPPPLGTVPNANTAQVAWVGTPEQRVNVATFLTLQNAINLAPAGSTVSIDPNGYAFTGALLINKEITIASAGATTLYSRFTVSGGSLTLANDVAIGVASTGAAVTVTASDVTLTNLVVRNTNAVTRPTGIQLAAGLTGVVINGFQMDAAGEASSFGINLTTGSAVINNPDLSGVAVGITVAAAAVTEGIVIAGGRIAAATTGISLGSARIPRVSRLELVGPGSTGVGPVTTGLDLANSSGALVTNVTVSGFARGMGTATTSTAAGPTITDVTIVGSAKEGLGLGTTSGAVVTRLSIAGTDLNASTGILLYKSVSARIASPIIVGMSNGITTYGENEGVGPIITAPRITALTAMTLGSTQRASVTDAVLDAGTWGGSGTGINLVNAGRVTVTNLTATGFLYAIGSQSNFDASSDRVNISISNLTVTGALGASSAVYLLGTRNVTISNVHAELTGAALVIHVSIGVTATDIVVTGRAGPTSSSGGAILRDYGSQDVDVNRSSITGGSYGFFYSSADGSTVTNATVAGVTERAIYARSSANIDVSASTFTGNAAVGALIVTTASEGISHDIAIHDNVMTGNLDGVHVLQGTTAVQIQRNVVSGQPNFVTIAGGHDLLVADNSVTQTAGAVAIAVAPLWADGARAGSYSSSGIVVQNNLFAGAGTVISVGSPDPSSAAAGRRTLRDPVLATGNVFPAASTAVRTYANAVVGADTASALARALPVDGPIAVDARDYDDPNDWGSACRATGFLDGASYYAGGGAAVYELTEAPVLYPMNCIELSLVETLNFDVGTVFLTGDVVTWTLTPHNAGPRAAPAGWAITQLLPDSVELVSMTGGGYSVTGEVATAAAELAAGADGPPLTVEVRIVAAPSLAFPIHAVAYVSPGPMSDLDEDGFVDVVTEYVSPLVVPTLATNTDVSATNNDAQGVFPAESGGGLPLTGVRIGTTLALIVLLMAGGALALLTRGRQRAAEPAA